MNRLKKKCASAILDELESQQRGKPAGSIPASVTLRYLAAADKHDLDKVTAVCIDLCSANFDLTTRKDIVDDKHLSDKTKVAILDKMCDRLGNFYDSKLSKIKKENENRCKDIESRRDKYGQDTKEWQKDFQEEVDGKIKNKQYRELYENLLEQFERTKRYMEQLEEKIAKIGKSVTDVVEPLRRVSLRIREAKSNARETEDGTQGKTMESVFSLDDEVNESFLEHLVEIRDSTKPTIASANDAIKTVRSTASDYFSEAMKNFDVGLFQDQLASTYDLQDRLDTTSTELDDRVQELGQLQALYECEKRQHEQSKARLVKQMKKVHAINTWLRWAKPEDDDENTCTCFRHVVAAKKGIVA